MTREEMISAIESMTVLELNELVKALEEKFGVSAAAPVAVAAAAAVRDSDSRHGQRGRHGTRIHPDFVAVQPLRGQYDSGALLRLARLFRHDAGCRQLPAAHGGD